MVLKFELERELEQKFRETAMKKYGYTKGSLQKASKEALKSWIMQQSDLPKEEDPFARVEGMLSRIKGKKTAVELQHEAKHQWMKSL